MSVPPGRWRVPGHIRCLLSHLCRRAGERRSKLASGDRVIHPDKPLVGPNHQNQLDRRISWTGQDNQPFNERTLQEIAKPVQVAGKSGSGQGNRSGVPGSPCNVRNSVRLVDPIWLLPDTVGGRGGETGIRTLGTLSRTHAFQACALNHSAISPASQDHAQGERAPDGPAPHGHAPRAMRPHRTRCPVNTRPDATRKP